MENLNLGSILGLVIEIVVLVLIFREIRELRRHQKALEKHEEQLRAVKPLISSLYTNTDEIMQLAISFTEDAKEIYAMGTIRSLLDTEMRHRETESDFEERLKHVSPKTINYVSATREHILRGYKYCRIMDLNIYDASDESILETLANIDFFIRLFGFRGTSKICLNLYHNPEILKGRGDFHFRCSDKQVILRAGGHGNQYSNAAIAITDARVIHEYQQYFKSLIHSPNTRRLDVHDLEQLRQLIMNRSVAGVSSFLFNLRKGELTEAGTH